MNRYHLGFFFSSIALVFLSLTFYRFQTIEEYQEANRRTNQLLQFAISNTTNTLKSEYDGINDYDRISNVFFESLSAMKEETSVKNGRIAAEDFYPCVPVILYTEKRYYNIGFFDGTDYIWEKEIPYDEEYHYLSECQPDELIVLMESDINEKLKIYHDNMNMPDVSYTIPNKIAMTPQEGTLFIVLENFPTIINGHYYSGIHDGNSLITMKE